jgi:lysophospholipase L1-like esterase
MRGIALSRRVVGALLTVGAVVAGLFAGAGPAAVAAPSGSGPSAVAAAAPGEPGDPNIHYTGRWDTSDPEAYTPYWAGAYLDVGFTGTTVQLRQRDTIDLWVSIDGGPLVGHTNVSGLVNLTPEPLSAGEHTLRVTYRVVAGSYTGDAVFQGLTLDTGAATYKAPARTKLIEFIGDSITAGTTSSQLAVTGYGFRTGEKLGHHHTQIAIGGMCLSETADGCWAHETRYWMASGGQAGTTAWDFTRYTADAVVINLGTNDIGHDVSAEEFGAAYLNLLRTVRAMYPDAWIFALETFRERYVPETEAAVRTVADEGDARVSFVDTTGWLGSGDLSDAVHPNDQGHRTITERLAPVIAERL